LFHADSASLFSKGRAKPLPGDKVPEINGKSSFFEKWENGKGV
jgi:hypothetical protein